MVKGDGQTVVGGAELIGGYRLVRLEWETAHGGQLDKVRFKGAEDENAVTFLARSRCSTKSMDI